MPRGLQILIPCVTRDLIWAMGVKVQSLNHWTAREFPHSISSAFSLFHKHLSSICTRHLRKRVEDSLRTSGSSKTSVGHRLVIITIKCGKFF